MVKNEQTKPENLNAIKNMDAAVSKAWKLFPQVKKKKIVLSLLKQLLKSKEPSVLFLEKNLKNKKLPFFVPLCILSPDWPGLSDSCIGVLHEKGWNISYIEAFVIEYENLQLGFLFLIIKIESHIERKQFFRDRHEIIGNLKVVATGSKAKTSLLIGEARKLEIYGHVTEKIKDTVEDKEALAEILSDDGEAFKFFSSRSESYLEERIYSDLAQQIVVNYGLQRLSRKSGGKPQFWIKNLKTSREHLTGITIAAFERDVSLNDWLESIYQAVPDYNIKYNKEFVTHDGIVVYRIEICNKMDKPYPKKRFAEIKHALVKSHISRRMERVRWMELIGGFEHYMRAIIPLLIKEYSLSRIPQVYISVVQMTAFMFKFKILIVSNAPKLGKMSYGYTITKLLEVKDGIRIISAKPPKNYGEVEVNIIDIAATLDMFPNIEDAYQLIRKTVNEVIGKFRDFDEGMRKLEVSKSTMVKKILKLYPDNLIREFYYRLDDFYRIGADANEIAEQIKLGIKGLDTYEKKKGEYIILSKEYSYKSEDKFIPTSTILVLVYSAKIKILSQILELLHNIEITLSKIERRDVTVLILRLQQNGKPIPPVAIKNVKNLLDKLTETN